MCMRNDDDSTSPRKWEQSFGQIWLMRSPIWRTDMDLDNENVATWFRRLVIHDYPSSKPSIVWKSYQTER